MIRTKGDNNEHSDVVLYPPGQTYVYRYQVVGLVRGYIPYIGWITVAFSEVPWLKQMAIISCLLVALFQTIFMRKSKEEWRWPQSAK